MSSTTPEFRCFAPRAPFSPLAEIALRVMNKARGFYRTRGMTVEDILRQITRERLYLEVFDVNAPAILNGDVLLDANYDPIGTVEGVQSAPGAHVRISVTGTATPVVIHESEDYVAVVRRNPDPAALVNALVEIAANGRARRVDATRWKAERCAKHGYQLPDDHGQSHRSITTH